MTFKNLTIEEHALDQSMRLFWQRGYFNCSIDELVKVSGINRATLYKQFGGKEGFFVAMLARYRDHITSQLFAPLQQNECGLTAIDAFFEQFVDLSEQGTLQHGCFFIATASELPSHQQATKEAVDTFLNELKSLFYQALERAKSQNTMSQSIDSQACSTFLIANIFGLFTLVRATNNSSMVSEQVNIIKLFLHSFEVTSAMI